MQQQIDSSTILFLLVLLSTCAMGACAVRDHPESWSETAPSISPRQVSVNIATHDLLTKLRQHFEDHPHLGQHFHSEKALKHMNTTSQQSDSIEIAPDVPTNAMQLSSTGHEHVLMEDSREGPAKRRSMVTTSGQFHQKGHQEVSPTKSSRQISVNVLAHEWFNKARQHFEHHRHPDQHRRAGNNLKSHQ